MTDTTELPFPEEDHVHVPADYEDMPSTDVDSDVYESTIEEEEEEDEDELPDLDDEEDDEDEEEE
jgi:hypothetical protein